jgi:Protein of unknown function (DUF5818)
MKRLVLSIIVAFTVCITAAVAQSGSMGGSAQGRQGSPPTAQPGQTQPGQTQPGYPSGPDMGSSQTDQNAPSANTGEKKLKGCVESQGGQYVLETKHGKAIALAGQDVSAHVGHEVAVKGTWENGNASGMSSTSTSSGSNAGKKTFNVTNVEMISDTCKGSKKNSTGTGAGSTGSSTGSGTNSGAGSTGTTPPQ